MEEDPGAYACPPPTRFSATCACFETRVARSRVSSHRDSHDRACSGESRDRANTSELSTDPMNARRRLAVSRGPARQSSNTRDLSKISIHRRLGRWRTTGPVHAVDLHLFHEGVGRNFRGEGRPSQSRRACSPTHRYRFAFRGSVQSVVSSPIRTLEREREREFQRLATVTWLSRTLSIRPLFEPRKPVYTHSHKRPNFTNLRSILSARAQRRSSGAP